MCFREVFFGRVDFFGDKKEKGLSVFSGKPLGVWVDHLSLSPCYLNENGGRKTAESVSLSSEARHPTESIDVYSRRPILQAEGQGLF